MHKHRLHMLKKNLNCFFLLPPLSEGLKVFFFKLLLFIYFFDLLIFFFFCVAAGNQSHDSTRSQLACSAEPQYWPLGSCRHMALFCLMTVCACACLRLEGGIPGEPADCRTPIKQKQIYSQYMPAKSQICKYIYFVVGKQQLCFLSKETCGKYANVRVIKS